MLKVEWEKALGRLNSRIYAQDGMSLTHDVWNMAHEYEMQVRQLLWHQHAGILKGLEVVASPSPDSRIFISPGAAINTNGQLIVLDKQRPENLSDALHFTQPVRVFIQFQENDGVVESAIHERRQEPRIVIQPATTELCEGCIEIARVVVVRRKSKNDPSEAKIEIESGDIDQSHCRFVSDNNVPILSIEVAGVGPNVDVAAHTYGMAKLMRSVNHAGHIRAVINKYKCFPTHLDDIDLLYLAWQANEPQTLQPAQADLLSQFLARGGTLWIEVVGADLNAVATTLRNTWNLSESPTLLVNADSHELLQQPFLFPQLPTGAARKQSPRILTFPNSMKGVLMSDAGYMHLWQGDAIPAAEPPTREMTRAAHELGENLLMWAAQRSNLLCQRPEGGRSLGA